MEWCGINDSTPYTLAWGSFCSPSPNLSMSRSSADHPTWIRTSYICLHTYSFTWYGTTYTKQFFAFGAKAKPLWSQAVSRHLSLYDHTYHIIVAIKWFRQLRYVDIIQMNVDSPLELEVFDFATNLILFIRCSILHTTLIVSWYYVDNIWGKVSFNCFLDGNSRCSRKGDHGWHEACLSRFYRIWGTMQNDLVQNCHKVSVEVHKLPHHSPARNRRPWRMVLGQFWVSPRCFKMLYVWYASHACVSCNLHAKQAIERLALSLVTSAKPICIQVCRGRRLNLRIWLQHCSQGGMIRHYSLRRSMRAWFSSSLSCASLK